MADWNVYGRHHRYPVMECIQPTHRYPVTVSLPTLITVGKETVTHP
jgi:hypothetical protein